MEAISVLHMYIINNGILVSNLYLRIVNICVCDFHQIVRKITRHLNNGCYGKPLDQWSLTLKPFFSKWPDDSMSVKSWITLAVLKLQTSFWYQIKGQFLHFTNKDTTQNCQTRVMYLFVMTRYIYPCCTGIFLFQTQF